jgi:hypothetical protein
MVRTVPAPWERAYPRCSDEATRRLSDGGGSDDGKGHRCPLASARALIPSCLRAFVPSSLHCDPVTGAPDDCAILLPSGGLCRLGAPARVKSTKSTPQKLGTVDTLGAAEKKTGTGTAEWRFPQIEGTGRGASPRFFKMRTPPSPPARRRCHTCPHGRGGRATIKARTRPTRPCHVQGQNTADTAVPQWGQLRSSRALSAEGNPAYKSKFRMIRSALSGSYPCTLYTGVPSRPALRSSGE